MDKDEELKNLIGKRNSLEKEMNIIVEELISQLKESPWIKSLPLPDSWYSLDKEHQKICAQIDGLYSSNEDIVLYTLLYIELEKRITCIKNELKKIQSFSNDEYKSSYENEIKNSTNRLNEYKKHIDELKKQASCYKQSDF